MILRRGLRFAESKCPCRAFSSHGNSLRPFGQFLQSRDDQPELHGDLAKLRSEQNRRDDLRTANIKTINELSENNKKAERIEDLQRLRINNWNPGDIYAPHDLSSVEVRKRVRERLPNQDAFDVLGINPLHEYKNPSIMWEYMAPIGKIKHRRETGLRPVNQRRIAKAIRRAVGMGLIPSVHPHPEVLEAAKTQREKLALEIAQGKSM